MEQVRKYIYVKKYAIFATLLGLILALFVLHTPKPKPSDTVGSFSAVRAAEHIEVISRKPHSYYDQTELEEVRVYIEDKLTTYFGAANVERINYTTAEVKTVTGDDLPYDLVNIVGKLQGESDKGLLLLAHYDSRGHVGRAGELGRSYGAMDDGYGVSSLLELAYILKAENPKNSIYFLFTDAEEIGLYGAKMAASDIDFLKDIRFVINLESRGQTGPSYMFETSKANHHVINLYKKANLPVTYSMATAVYSVMPNSTDFTPFIGKVPGLNFATLAGLDYYHSPLDAYENIDLSSVQHMGGQVEPVIREFIGDAKYVEDNYFDAKHDQVFFTLFAGVLITYSQTFAVILAVLLVLLLGFYLFMMIKNETLEKETFKKVLPKGLLLTVILVALGYLFSRFIALAESVPFSLTYMRVKGYDEITLLFMVMVVVVYKIKVKKVSQTSVILIGVMANVLLTLLTTFTLPGASFLFSVTALFGLVALFAEFVKQKPLKHVIYAISYIVPMLIIIPLLYSFYMALTIGGVAILVLLMIINVSVTISVMNKHFHLEKVSEYYPKQEA